MEFAADLHLHSRFSRATSSELDLEHAWIWAQRKGLSVIGTGDFTHPAWFAELEEKLVPTGDGLYALQPALAQALNEQVPPACHGTVRFMLTVEISTIYKRGEKTRKVHHLICVPDLAAAAALNRSLARRGNLQADGRPILGLDSHDLLECVLEADPRAVLIPAHIWTPWFSVLGSKSGFDSIEECYRELSPQIFALETGLSSDPAMNWRLSVLDRYALVSNSDAHSPAKLGREANLFRCELSYEALFAALRHPQREGFAGTIEFFPEEGKYHLDGHRRCEARLEPAQTRAGGGLCPVCGRAVTVGVLYRVEELADRPLGFRPPAAPPYQSLVGLAEVLGEVLGAGPATKGVTRLMEQCLELGPELELLRRTPLEELGRVGGPVLAEALRRMRAGEVHIEGGYDGEFGRIHLLEANERRRLAGQTTFFAEPARAVAKPSPSPQASVPAVRARASRKTSSAPAPGFLEELTAAQREAVVHEGAPLVIQAGPGTGKTRTLTYRLAERVRQGGDPAEMLAVTFTTKAAAEMASRLSALLGAELAQRMRVCTFHALALAILHESREQQGLPPWRIIDEEQRRALLAELLPRRSAREQLKAARELSEALLGGHATPLCEAYRAALGARGCVDLDSMVPEAVDLLQREPADLASWRRRCQVLCVDEYQDVNPSQFALLALLYTPEADLCVIGDPDQAIYSFRGADPRHFGAFATEFPGARRLTLERSYRTASALLEAAQQVIQHNVEREPLYTSSEQPGAERVVVCRAASPAAEAAYVVQSIEQLLEGTSLYALDSGRAAGAAAELGAACGELSFADVAVLARLGAQLEVLEQAFAESGMPYRCSASAARPHPLEPVLAALRWASEGAPDAEPPEPRMRALCAQLATSSPREGLATLVAALCSEEQRGPALELTGAFAAQLYGVQPRLESWAPLVLALAAGASEADRLGPRSEAVSLLTLHASKGLEFKVVFIVGAEEGLLPHVRAGEPLAEERLAEERRLFYVGMTRAERLLVVTHAAHRSLPGQPAARAPSRFVAEIAPALRQEVQPAARPRRRAAQLELF